MSLATKALSPYFRKMMRRTFASWEMWRDRRRGTAWPLTRRPTASTYPSKNTMEFRQRASPFLKYPLPEVTMAATQIPATPAPGPAEASLAQFALYFLRLGCFGFGGPIALVGYMQKDLVEERQWIAQQDYLDGLAFSQLAPGPLAAQLAMYLGFVRAGLWGATAAGVAFILPSFLMVVAIGEAYAYFWR